MDWKGESEKSVRGRGDDGPGGRGGKRYCCGVDHGCEQERACCWMRGCCSIMPSLLSASHASKAEIIGVAALTRIPDR